MMQSIAVALAAPVATGIMYLVFVGGNVAEFFRSEGLISGFFWIAGTGIVGGLLLALGALVREREAQLRSQTLEFALERSRLEHQALDARLKLLHSQIEPHFLFNTLANIQALVETGSPQAAPVLGSLIRYLRASMPQLKDGNPTLGQEARRVEAYLELMRMRMPDRLQVGVAVDPALERLRFPPMGLLTLVENAVRHGIDPHEAGGRIDVKAWRDERGAVRIAVTDDGAGFSADAPTGTGLANLRERLEAFYDGKARLDLSEVQPHGVHAEIVIVGAE
jgi:LytS/YehU family sensor histidine kinase